MADLISLYKLGLEGAEMGKQRGLASLYGQAYNAPREQRQEIIGKMAGTSPEFAMGAQKSFADIDETAQQELGRTAKMIIAAPPEMRPQLWAQAHARLSQMGFHDMRPEWSDDALPMAEKLATMFGGDTAAGVHSAFRGQNGNMWVLGRDGQARDTGAPFDPNTQLIEGAGGYFGVNKSNMQATPVQVGQPGMQAQRAPGEVPYSIDPSLPPEVQAAIRADEAKFAQAPDGANIAIGSQGGGQLQAAPKELNPIELARLQLSQQEAAKPSDFERKLQMAQAMGATPDQLRNMVLGDSGGGKVTATMQRQANTAKAKLIDLNAIRAQLARVNQTFGPLQGTLSATPYVGKFIPTEEGKRFDATVSMLQGMVRKLTRTPGEGAMSDYETKLAQLANPSRSEYESVTADQIAQLEELVQTMTQGYEALLQDNGGNSANIQQQQQDKPPSSDIGDLLGKYGVR